MGLRFKCFGFWVVDFEGVGLVRLFQGLRGLYLMQCVVRHLHDCAECSRSLLGQVDAGASLTNHRTSF